MNNKLFGTVAGIVCVAILAYGMVITTPTSGGSAKQHTGETQSWVQQPQRLDR